MILSMLELEPGSLEGAGKEGKFAHVSNCILTQWFAENLQIKKAKTDTAHVQ